MTFRQIFPFLLIFIFCLPLIIPFLKKGYFTTHDGEWAIVRLTAFHFALKDGQIPPRWAGNLFHSYGYPVMNFNYPLPTMVGELFHLSGLSFVNSVKAVFIISIIFSGFFIYLLLKEFFNKFIALTAVIIYLYYPFRLVNLFVRGSIGESLSFSILPLVYWSLVKFKKDQQNKKWLIISSVSLALLILAHNSIALATFPFVVLFMILSLIKEKNYRKLLYRYIAILLFALGLSCFFWLPAMWEKQWVILKPEIITKPTDHFPSLSQLIIPSWGYGRSKESNSLSFQLGPVQLLLALISLPLSFKNKDKLAIFFVLTTVINIFLLLPISSFFWKHLPLMPFLSYPWRLLVPLGFYFSFLAGFVLQKFRNKNLQIALMLGIFLILFFTTSGYRRPLADIDKPDIYYITNQATTIEGDENTPIWVKIPPKQAPAEKIEVDGEYKIKKQKSNLLQFNLDTAGPQQVIINTIYYPGWRLFINGVEQKINYQNDRGLITFFYTGGRGRISLVFSETPLRLFSDIISLGSFFVILTIFLSRRKIAKFI